MTTNLSGKSVIAGIGATKFGALPGRGGIEVFAKARLAVVASDAGVDAAVAKVHVVGIDQTLVDIDALVAGLHAGRPGAAALDVLPHEPEVPTVLRDAMEGPGGVDVILTPHVAFSSTASVTELRVRATEDLLRVLRGEPPLHPVA